MASYAEANLGTEIAQIALMHDATEAYLIDVIRLIKAHCPTRDRGATLALHCRAFGLPCDPR